MTNTVQKNNRTAIFIVAWIGLFIFNFLFARLTTMVPVSLISIFMFFTAGALYKDNPTLRPFALIGIVIGILFIALTYFGTIWFRYEVVSLLDIRGPQAFQIGFYLLAFLNASAFTTIGLALFKALRTMRGMIITFLITALIYFLISYLSMDLIKVIMEMSAQIPQG